MNQSTSGKSVFAAAITSVVALFATSAWSQPPSGQFMRLFGEIPVVTLAQIDEVSSELKLSDQQKSEMKKLNDELNTKRRDAFMSAQGDFEAVREAMGKFNAEAHKDCLDALQPEQ